MNEIRTLDFFESMKLPHNNLIAKIKYIRYGAFLWYRILSFCENSVVKGLPVKNLSLNKNRRGERIIASLTSYPGRINVVHLAIKSIFLQTVKPDLIVLWLARNQFPNGVDNKELKNLVERGLEIRYIDDYRSYKKYMVALQKQQSNELVITFDDDIIYHPHTIENCLKKHNEFPNSIVVSQSLRIAIVDKKIQDYRKWKVNQIANSPSYLNMPLTGSGCLYPYGILNEDAFNWELIKKLAPNTDDLWIMAQSVLSGIRVVAVDKQAKIFTTVDDSQASHLAMINCIDGGNDITVQRLITNYPLLKQRLLNEK